MGDDMLHANRVFITRKVLNPTKNTRYIKVNFRYTETVRKKRLRH